MLSMDRHRETGKALLTLLQNFRLFIQADFLLPKLIEFLLQMSRIPSSSAVRSC